jgi:hypothetical protein
VASEKPKAPLTGLPVALTIASEYPVPALEAVTSMEHHELATVAPPYAETPA